MRKTLHAQGSSIALLLTLTLTGCSAPLISEEPNVQIPESVTRTLEPAPADTTNTEQPPSASPAPSEPEPNPETTPSTQPGTNPPQEKTAITPLQPIAEQTPNGQTPAAPPATTTPAPTPAPSVTLQQHITAATLTANATELLYTLNTEIGPANLINTNCSDTNANQGSNILGCFITGINEMYIFDITDSRVMDAETVVVAHELLHAVWFTQLTRSQRDTLTQTLTTYFNALPSGHYLRGRLAGYSNAPETIPTELHSILGTEAPNLPASLETHYAQYFTDRNRIVQYSQNTFEYIHNLENQARQSITNIDNTLASINNEQVRLANIDTQLNNDIATFNAAVENGEYATETEYNTARTELENRQTQLNTDYTAYNQSITNYNTLINEYNQLANLINELNTALSTSPLT